MNIKRIKKYILPIFLSLACVLTGCSQSNGNNGNNTAQKEEPSLEGTWKVKDLPETIKQHLEGTSVSSESIENIKNYYNEADIELTIKDKDVVLTNTFDANKLYEADFKRSGYKRHKDLDDFKKSNAYMFNLYKSKLEHTEASIENSVINVKVKDGVLDTENKTISFPETPRIDDLYLLGIYTDKRELNPVTYNYKLENNELILTVSGENRYKKEQTVVVKFTKEK